MSRPLILKKRRVIKSDRLFYNCAKVAARQGDEQAMFDFLSQIHFDTIKDTRILRDKSFEPYREKLKKILQLT